MLTSTPLGEARPCPPVVKLRLSGIPKWVLMGLIWLPLNSMPLALLVMKASESLERLLSVELLLGELQVLHDFLLSRGGRSTGKAGSQGFRDTGQILHSRRR